MASLKLLPAWQSRSEVRTAIRDLFFAEQASPCVAHRLCDISCKSCVTRVHRLADQVVELLFEDPLQNHLFRESHPKLTKLCLEFLRTVRRFGPLPKVNWKFDLEREIEWFETQIEQNKRFQKIDLEMLLLQWQAHLEHEYEIKKQGRPSHRFPRGYKKSLLNFIKLEMETKAERRKLPDKWTALCMEIRRKTKKTSVGRRETDEEFEDRVKRICNRKGVTYVAPEH